jgi:alkylhydroperoxidase family enzyme
VTNPSPRIRPLPRSPVPEEVRAAPEGWLHPDAQEIPVPLDTFARHPAQAKALLGFNRHLFGSTLPPRTRGLPVLRTAAICDCAFEREQHEIVARREGIDDRARGRAV